MAVTHLLFFVAFHPVAESATVVLSATCRVAWTSGSLKLCDNPVAEKGGNFATRHFKQLERSIQMKGTHHFVAIGALMFLMMTGQALADCVLNGKRLPEGTRIGSLVCEFGQWVDKPEKP